MEELNSLEAYRINFQSVYHNQVNALSLSLNLLEFAYFQFKSTYLYQNQGQLREICEINKGTSIGVQDIEGFVKNALIDDIKVSICFENLFKAFLLANYYVVHEIDRNILPELWKTQKERPLIFTDILKDVPWIENEKIDCQDSQLKNHIRGIKNKTLSYSLILNNSKYQEFHKIDREIIDLLKIINDRRNELHLQSVLQFQVANSTYSNFCKLNKFLEKNINQLQDDISNHLGIKDHERIPTMIISRK
jgi:hypothetical protein